MMPCAKRRAFTLIELLVVIAIIGLLVSLVLPAVQAARESGRRTQCANNLKQLGLAFHNYHDALGQFPPSYLMQVGGGGIHGAPDPTTRDAGPGWAWGALLMPYLEQGGLYRAFDMNRPCWASENAIAAATQVSLFLCPSGLEVGGEIFDVTNGAGDKLARFARSHYVCNVGQEEPWGFTLDHYDGVADGPLFRNGWVRAADVIDGLSQTVFLGEHHPMLSSKTWVGVVPGASVCPTDNFAFSSCDHAATLVNVHSGPASDEFPPVIHPPNSPMCHVCQMYSAHDGGCNVLFGDGGVRFISEFIHQPTWAALSSRNEAEVIGGF